MKLKVCGMRERRNIQELISLAPDFIGFIFYEKSSRFISSIADLPDKSAVKRVGVFVNATQEEIFEKVKTFQLDMIQLHGNEPVELVKRLKGVGLSIIKVFGVMDELPIKQMQEYEPYVDFFLFDTKTSSYGGSGKKFNWSVLKGYHLTRPFFLSGGIDLEDIEAIKKLQLEKLYAIDVNSRFEMSPGLKDLQKVKELKRRMNTV